MKRNILLTLCLMFVAMASLMAQDMSKVRSLNRSGNDKYNDGRYQEAEMDYRRALAENPNDTTTCFNLATTLIRQQDEAKIMEADSLLTLVIRDAEREGCREIAASALYQKGEIAMMAQQYQQAAEMYKESLKRRPLDHEARFNYILARKLMKDDQNQDNQNQDNQNQDNQNQDQQQQQQQDQQQNQDQNQQNQDQNQDQQQQPEQQQQQQQMSEDQRQSILEQNERDEKETQQRVMQKKQERDADKEREMEIRRMNGTLKDW